MLPVLLSFSIFIILFDVGRKCDVLDYITKRDHACFRGSRRNNLFLCGVYLFERNAHKLSAAGLLSFVAGTELAMFEQTFVTEAKTGRERTIACAPILQALVLQALGITGLVLLPLWNTEPIEAGKRFLLLPPVMGPKQPVLANRPAGPRSSAPALRMASLKSLTHPFMAPTHIAALQPEDAPALSVGPALATGGLLAGENDLYRLSQSVAPPPASPKPHVAPKPPHAPVHVSTGISQSLLLSGPKPVYPRFAMAARVSGTVRLQAIISREGRIENLHVLSGHPLLNESALDAVRQWRYRPLLLNGDPVEAITEIDVNFTLN